jgi:hypothetical protein
MKEGSHWVPSLFAKGINAIRSSWQQKNKGPNRAKLLGALHVGSNHMLVRQSLFSRSLLVKLMENNEKLVE